MAYLWNKEVPLKWHLFALPDQGDSFSSSGVERSAFSYDFTVIFPDTIFGNNTSDAACGVDIGISADNCTGIQDAVAADLNIVAEHSAYLLDTGNYLLIAGLDDHIRLIGLDI